MSNEKKTLKRKSMLVNNSYDLDKSKGIENINGEKKLGREIA